jgi:hypothetical protein
MSRNRLQRDRDREALRRSLRRKCEGGFVHFPIYATRSSGLPPTLTSVTPALGNDRGGTNVNLVGTNFVVGQTSFSAGGVAMTGVNVTSTTTATAVTGAHARGQVNVQVTTPVGSDTLTNGYEYLDALSTSFGTNRVWFRADKGVTHVSNAVSQWADQSGAGDSNRNLVQSTAGAKPTLVESHASFNNRHVLDHDGGDWMQTLDFTGGPYAHPLTIYCVFRFTVDTNFYLFYDRDGSSVIRSYRGAAADTNIVVGTGAGGFAGTDNRATLNSALIACFVLDDSGAGSKMFINRYSTASGSGTAGTDAFKALTLFGIYIGGGGPTGQCAEFAAYSGAHNATQRENWIRYYGGDSYAISVIA